MTPAALLNSLPRSVPQAKPAKPRRTVVERFDGTRWVETVLEHDGASYVHPKSREVEESVTVAFRSTIDVGRDVIPVAVEATVFPAVKAHWASAREARAAEAVIEQVRRTDTGEKVDIGAMGTIELGKLELDATTEVA